MKSKLILGGVVIVSLSVVSYIVLGNSTVEVTPEPEVVEEVTPLEKLTKEITESKEFQNEIRLRAEARAMYQLSVLKQDEALELSEKALETYKMANTLENDWKLNQSVTK